MTLYAQMLERAAARPDAPALIDIDGTSIDRATLHEQVRRLAGALVRAGVACGDRVAVQVPKSGAAVQLYLACLRLGAVYLPLNTAYTPHEVAYFLGDARPRVLVVDPEHLQALGPAAQEADVGTILTLGADGAGSLTEAAEAAAAVGIEAPMVARQAEDPAAILYTSGTTGRSKGAMLSCGNLLSNAQSLVQLWGFSEDDRLLHSLPIYHVHGLFVALHCALLSGAVVRLLPGFDAAAVSDELAWASVYMGVPTHYVRLLDHAAFNAQRCAGVRLFVSGSAPLLPDTFAEFEARTGQRILERYGMTEAGMIASNPLSGPRVPGTVGFALPDVDVRLRDEDGGPVAAGGVGVLELRGPNVFAGYWQQAEKTAQSFRDGDWFITGDLARIDADDRIAIVGRARDLVISGGLNVYPSEVEAEIDALVGVSESAVVGAPHGDFGEAVVAFVVPAPGAGADDRELIASLRQRLAAFKVPKAVLFVEALPRNTMGKVQKQRLREQCQGLFDDPPQP